jgi:hypothetical protein
MRLLNAKSVLRNPKSMRMKDFLGEDIPPYAILSHTWGEEEYLYADALHGSSQKKEGFAKIRFCCDQAVQDGLEWVWVDT